MSEDKSMELFKNNPENAHLFNKGDNNNIIQGNNNTINNTVNHYHKPPKVKNEITPDETCITGTQAAKIKELVKNIAEKEVIGGMDNSKAFAKTYSSLYKHMGVSSYLLIKKEHYSDAIKYLNQQNALKRSKTRRRNNKYWREDIYKAIYARARELGISKEELYTIVGNRFDTKITSLKELGEQKLDRLRKYLFSK